MSLAAQSLPRSPSPGEVIGDRFRVEHELGAGGMGAVYAAIDLHTGARVALKLMRPELSTDERAIERFRREGAALAAIRHPAVVQIREIGELEGGMLYLAMELLSGETLADRLRREGTMSPVALLPILTAICEALAAAHAGGVIHRDIKPSNIHLQEDGSVKLVDFGVARVRGYHQVTSSGLAVGTVRYMAPEQLGGGAVDERVDLYALGIVMYEALSGENPFERTAGDDAIGAILVGRATPLSTLRPDLGPELTRVVHRAMARMATERFASTTQLASAFRAAMTGAPLPSLPGPALGYAPTALATPQRPVSSPPIPKTSVRPSKRSKRRALAWMLIPLVTGACIAPLAAGAAFVGCSGLVYSAQARLGLDQLRGPMHTDPAFADLRADYDQLDQLVKDDRLGMLGATALSERITISTRDDRIDHREAVWIMVVGRDLVAHGGNYDFDEFSKMHTATEATASLYGPQPH